MHDNGRRAVPHNFRRVGDPVAQFHNCQFDIAKCCGILDPRIEMINSQGNWGLDILVKLKNTGEQENHTDGNVNPLDPVFLSYADTLKQREKYERYDSRIHGAVNVFTNSSRTKADCLIRPDNRPINMPVLTTTFVAAYLPHHGSGNYSQEPVFKQFTYGDCPDFDRAGSVEQFKVYFHNLYEVVVFRTAIPHSEVYHEPLHFYPCVKCGKSDYYTYPVCADCLLHQYNLLLICSGSRSAFSLGVLFVGEHYINKDYRVPCDVQAEIMTEEDYHTRFHQRFRTFGLVSVIKLPLNAFNAIQHYLVYLVKHSFLAAMRTSDDPEVYNVELVDFLEGQGGAFLRATRSLFQFTELVLHTSNAPDQPLFKDLLVAVDPKAFTTANNVTSVFEAEADCKIKCGDVVNFKRKAEVVWGTSRKKSSGRKESVCNE
jgi:hypothetical protein